MFEGNKRLVGPAILSMIVNSLLLPILVYAKEENLGGFKTFLVNLTGHHWTAHGILTIVLFVVFWMLFYFIDGEDGKITGIMSLRNWTIVLIIFVLIGVLSIYGFFYTEFHAEEAEEFISFL
jgi:hypothetical protein